jgi:hypothetical protein
VSEKGVLWDTFEPKRKDVTGGCKRLHNEELRNFHVVCGYVASKGRRDKHTEYLRFKTPLSKIA